MKIEEEIKSTFTSEYHKGLVNLIYTHNFLINKMNLKFKEVKITRQQYNVLRILRGQFPEPVPISVIKERMLDKMSDASRIVDRLIKKGVIEKTNSETDRRAVDIIINKTGLDLLKSFEPISSEFNMLLTELDEEEIKTLNDLLDKIRSVEYKYSRN